MTDTEPKIDFTQIEFPSDKLTIKMLRQVWPDATDVDRWRDTGRAPHRVYVRHSLDNVLGDGIIDLERLIAERAFKVALGQPVKDNPAISNKDELIECVSNTYLKYGLSRGEHETAQMIRRIEAQAEAQARQHGGHIR